ncbi:hypothetical protein G7Y79_00073g098190 [Physcia stellaris]|nr:hypothetical protein G7Y79_00073g098190 [Physcia stellaris]
MSEKTNAAMTAPPFRREHQLNNELDGTAQGQTIGCLPSQPNIPLSTSKQLSDFLLGDICPTKLNGLAPHLWLCSTPSHTNIPPLHHHAIHGRTIIASEDPALHLIWFTGRIFIKPLPAYLLSHAFWQQYIYGGEPCENKKLIAESGLGLLRSYIYSICYERDLRIAQEPHLALVPRKSLGSSGAISLHRLTQLETVKWHRAIILGKYNFQGYIGWFEYTGGS